MTDYIHATGASATMMIRDAGNTIEFWINSNNSDTFNHDLPWAYVINGSSSSWLAFNYNAGAGWQRLGSWTVTTNQTVTFKLNATGTSGFGGPTTFSHAVVRTTVPGTPAKPSLSGVALTSITVSWTPPSNGGSAITRYILGYGKNPGGPTTEVTTVSPHTVLNLSMNTIYYFWVKAGNAVGLGPYSASSSAKTYLGVYVNVGGVWKPALPYVRVGGVWKLAEPHPVYTFHPL